MGLTYCNKYDMIKPLKGGEKMAQDIGKALQELSRAIENNEAVESVVINGAGGRGRNMVIRKENKEYRVTERRECWVLSCTIGGLSVEYKVPKDICANEEELRAYVKAETLF